MGFPLVIKVPKRLFIYILRALLYQIKLMFESTMIFLILFERQEIQNQDQEQRYHTDNYVMLMDDQCPLPVPISIQSLSKLIKTRLPATTYRMLLEKQGNKEIKKTETKLYEEEEEEEEETRCSVCLDGVEGRHEVRELLNCCHVFHKDCLDSWVGVGQYTCPVCRSLLLPDKVGSITRTLLLMERNSNSLM